MKEPSPRLPEREKAAQKWLRHVWVTPSALSRVANYHTAEFWFEHNKSNSCHEYLSVEESNHLLSASQAREQKLREALKHLLENYLSLANSGDAGFWDAEKEPEVIDAREALSGSGEKA